MNILTAQLALKKAGLFIGKCDGDIGSNDFKWSLIKLQNRYGLESTGRLDKNTIEKLNELIKWYEESEIYAYTE